MARQQRVVSCAAFDAVITHAAVKQIATAATVDGIVAFASLNGVGAGADSRQVVGVVIAHDSSLACDADILDVDQDVAIGAV